MHVNKVMVGEERGAGRLGVLSTPPSVQSPAPGSGGRPDKEAKPAFPDLMSHREMSQMQEEVQWKFGSECCSGVVESVWTGN